jgi:hypothetical protein
MPLRLENALDVRPSYLAPAARPLASESVLFNSQSDRLTENEIPFVSVPRGVSVTASLSHRTGKDCDENQPETKESADSENVV